MNTVSRFVGRRLAEPSSNDVVFEGPFAAGKKVAFAADQVVAHLASITRAIDELLVAGGRGNVRQPRVGVLSNHRVETYLAVLACASAGVTFVPLNPKFPVERLGSIVELSGIDLVLGDVTTRNVHDTIARDLAFLDVASIPADPDEVGTWLSATESVQVGPEGVAYMMFTSGSTGQPKGVPISYGNLLSYVDGVTELLGLPRNARFTQFFDLSFDLSMHDIFVSLRAGGTLVAPSQIDLMMPGAYVSREAIDVWFSVPILGAQLGNGKPKEGFAGLRSMLFCGEALPMETVVSCRPWLAPSGRMWNLYGPTEATIAFTAADVTDSPRTDGNASIGHGFGVNSTAVLTTEGDVVTEPRVGDEGELLLGGPQVFSGYSTDAPSPFVDTPSGRFYRSGDLVRFDDEGVYFRGRIDSQVKFRGYRIELGEIETAARRTFGLKTLAVVIVGAHTDAKLVMFHLKDEVDPGTSVDARLLETTLPKYMIPSETIALDSMPTNQNGKIDRRRLAAGLDGSA